ncbi:uncharacterized protein FTJAE_11048 [Fusarium tjaetaba]|uniref:F-box domain-containing protein n=1 Tax=Fusarium tjaetaba TaxID=1567544 RepID=A0A8H5VFY9_9HYPO|nr:uncharacterized protein FTJAE_11048 [Fusarium tjaetaba]KAF5622081.1 hypothetical protein FTJAE_11048 [Fusarium tjaetaba]
MKNMSSNSIPGTNSALGLSSITKNNTVSSSELLETCFYKRTKYYYPTHDPKAEEFSPPVHSLFAGCYKTQTPNLGILARLPQDILEGIVLQLDIDSYRRFRQVSRRARYVSTAINIYQRVLRHAPDALNALRRTDLSSFVSYADIYTALTTTKCAFCGQFGDFLFLPTAKRCCFQCLRTSPETALVNEARISRREQWKGLYAEQAVALTNALKSKDIRTFKTHNWDDPKIMSETRGVLAKDLLAVYISVDSTMEIPGQALLRPGWLHYRLAASIIFPSLIPRTGKLKTGLVIMSSSKEAEHLANSSQPSDPSPAYQEEAGPSSANEPSSDKIPTAENPFNFPSASPLPSYSEASSAQEPPIAIPQENPTQTSPFLKAYAPALLGHGITKEAWGSFLDTISAFMTAKVGERAINHAGDVAKSVGQQPVNYVKNVQNHAKSVGKNIAANTKRGNILGAAAGVVGGAISIPLGAVFGAVGTVVSLPGRTIAAATRKPKTPAERAVAYVVVANHDWLNKRGLHASLINTEQLSKVVGVSVKALLEASAEGDKSAGPLGPLSALSDHIAHLEVNGPGVVDIGAETWWLVLVRIEATA